MLVIFVAAMTTRFPLLAPLVHAGNDIGLRHPTARLGVGLARMSWYGEV